MNVAEHRQHERVLTLAASAIDFELTSAESSELETHLADCSRCRRDVAGLRTDAAAVHVSMGLSPSRRVDEALYREIARGKARPQGFLLLVAAALFLLGLLAAVAAGSALLDRDILPVTLVPPAPVIDADQKPDAPAVAAAPVGETWQMLDVQAGASGGLIEAVTFAGTDLVGVGRVGCAGDPADDPTGCYGAAWTAGVGDALTRVPDHDGLRVGITVPTNGPEKGLFDVASGPAGVVAIGYALDDELGGPRIWHSSDGRTWQRAGFTFGPSGEQARFSAIASGARGYVIVGWVISDTGRAARAAAWVSPDGMAWTRAADTEIMDVGPCFDTGEEPSCGGMLGVTSTGSGFVAVGQARSDAGSLTRPAAWTSPDGLSWTRSDIGLDFDGQLSSVTVADPGLVAVGTICQPSCSDLSGFGGVAATSPDGSIWTVSMVVDGTALSDVASADGRVFALGASVVLEPPAHLQLWRTDDAVTWRQVPGLPTIPDAVSSYQALDLAARPDRLVVAGWAETSGDFRNFAYVSPPAGSVAPSTDAPPPAPTASPTRAPSPNGPAASSIDPVVMLRVDIRPDVSVGRFPSLTVYRDGTVLRRDDAGARVTRLDPGGLELLLAPALASDLLTTSGEIPVDPAHAAGYVTYSIDLRRTEGMVHRSTTNALTPRTRTEGERIIALAERLDELESWLPADVWATGPSAATAYVPTNLLLKVTVFEHEPGGQYPPLALDLAEVDWPLEGRLVDLGGVLVVPPLGPGSTSRCGSVTLSEAQAVVQALASAPLRQESGRMAGDIDWAAAGRHASVSLAPLLPEDPLDCMVDQSWP